MTSSCALSCSYFSRAFILRAGTSTNEPLHMNYKAMLMRRGNVLETQSERKLDDNNQQESVVWHGRRGLLWNNVWCRAILRAGMDQPYFFGEILLTVHNGNRAKQQQSQWLDLVMRLAGIQGSTYKEWQNADPLRHAASVLVLISKRVARQIRNELY